MRGRKQICIFIKTKISFHQISEQPRWWLSGSMVITTIFQPPPGQIESTIWVGGGAKEKIREMNRAKMQIYWNWLLNNDKNYGKLSALGWSSVLSSLLRRENCSMTSRRDRLSAMKRRIKISFTTRKKWFAMTERDKVLESSVNLKASSAAAAEAVNYSPPMMTFQIGSDSRAVMEKDLLSSALL